MDAAFWERAWQEDRIGFHQHEVHAALPAYHDSWLDGGSGVLVPLAGKSLDVSWLSERMPTVAVELSAKAVQALHEESGLEARVEEDGAYRAWRSEGLTVLQGDVFELEPRHVEGIDRVWDRAALVALDPPRRLRYAAMLRRLLPEGTQILLSSFAYDQRVMPGPPHSVPEAEVRALYRGATVEVLQSDDTLPPPWEERGHRWWKRSLYRITL